jgi:hypothetical protein
MKGNPVTALLQRLLEPDWALGATLAVPLEINKGQRQPPARSNPGFLMNSGGLPVAYCV